MTTKTSENNIVNMADFEQRQQERAIELAKYGVYLSTGRRQATSPDWQPPVDLAKKARQNQKAKRQADIKQSVQERWGLTETEPSDNSGD